MFENKKKYITPLKSLHNTVKNLHIYLNIT